MKSNRIDLTQPTITSSPAGHRTENMENDPRIWENVLMIFAYCAPWYFLTIKRQEPRILPQKPANVAAIFTIDFTQDTKNP